MALINIGDKQRQELLALPESGMGFQLVKAMLQGSWHRLLVFNATSALDLAGLNLQESDDPAMIASNEARIIAALTHGGPTLFMAPGPHSFSTMSTRISTATQQVSLVRVAATPSSLVKHVVLAADRVFHRFSAFKPDRRVDPVTGAFLPGTFAVPELETAFVKTGFAAVGRYALPNTLPASNHYVIRAPIGTHVSFGTVAPAFGQAGGGVEAFFASAVVNKAPRVAPSQIPDE